MADRANLAEARAHRWLVTVGADNLEFHADVEGPDPGRIFAPINSRRHGEQPIADLLVGIEPRGAFIIEQSSAVQLRRYLDLAASGVANNAAIGSLAAYHIVTIRDPADAANAGTITLHRVRFEDFSFVNAGGKRQMRIPWVARAPINPADPIMTIGTSG